MKRRRPREELNLDLTPLMDLMFLLIIFFLVSSVFKTNEAILQVQLPKADGGTKKVETPKNLLIELNKDGFAVNAKKSTLEDFAAYCANVTDKNIPVDLRIDKSVVYDKVVQVLSILQKYKLANLSLITEFK